MSSRTSQWRQFNQQLLRCLETDSDEQIIDQPANEIEHYNLFNEENSVSGNSVSGNSSDGSVIEPMDIVSHCSDASSGDNSLEFENNGTLHSKLATWAVRQNISHVALNGLLQILQGHVNEDLPTDARTVLRTPRQAAVVDRCGGDFIYLGIKSGVLRCSQFRALLVNIDGLPLFKSSDVEVWPILGTVNGGDPFVIALWSGSGKPQSVLEFLKEFLTEYNTLCHSGIETADGVVEFELKCFSCDAPARQFLKRTKGHTGYYACERCTVKGERHGYTMTFEDTNCSLRNDEDFNDFVYTDHQHSKSELINYEIPCIGKFALDYMHLVCLGVVKRILYFLQGGPRICRLSRGQLTIISTRLDALRNQLPAEFARQPRGLKHLKRWKATEFKQFLLYTGMFVLKGVVKKELYDHFLTI